jgi:hypothetical protein
MRAFAISRRSTTTWSGNQQIHETGVAVSGGRVARRLAVIATGRVNERISVEQHRANLSAAVTCGEAERRELIGRARPN